MCPADVEVFRSALNKKMEGWYSPGQVMPGPGQGPGLGSAPRPRPTPAEKAAAAAAAAAAVQAWQDGLFRRVPSALAPTLQVRIPRSSALPAADLTDTLLLPEDASGDSAGVCRGWHPLFGNDWLPGLPLKTDGWSPKRVLSPLSSETGSGLSAYGSPAYPFSNFTTGERGSDPPSHYYY
jgi:hypothetical protein